MSCPSFPRAAPWIALKWWSRDMCNFGPAFWWNVPEAVGARTEPSPRRRRCVLIAMIQVDSRHAVACRAQVACSLNLRGSSRVCRPPDGTDA